MAAGCCASTSSSTPRHYWSGLRVRGQRSRALKRPDLHIAELYLRRLAAFCIYHGNQADVTVAVGSIGHGIDWLMVHIELERVACGHYSYQIGFTQARVDGRIGAIYQA